MLARGGIAMKYMDGEVGNEEKEWGGRRKSATGRVTGTEPTNKTEYIIGEGI